MKYVEPKTGLKSFTCPHCGVYSRQYHYSNEANLNDPNTYSKLKPVRTNICEHCGSMCLWYKDKMVYPNRGNSPPPNSDMPDNVKRDYEEAASISTLSPKGAAALLRLAIQKLTINLGGKGKNINDDIAYLVKNGLPKKLQKALDVVRVIGNNAVHPGQIETDNPDVVGKLFSLLNVITEYMISMPNRIDTLYNELPDSTKESIEKRDKNSP